MPSLQEQIHIAVPPERVFELLVQPERGPQWTPNLVRVERTSQIESGPGVETAIVANVGGRPTRGVGRCLAMERPHRLVIESSFDIGVTSTTIFELAEQGAGTHLVARVDYTLPSKGLGKLLGGLLGDTIARRDLRQALANLKQILEASKQ